VNRLLWRRIWPLVGGAVLLVVAAPGFAVTPITLEHVLTSSREHFPRVQSAVAEVLAQRGRVTEALGAFDLALEQDSLIWADGYYDGLSTDSKLVKPIGPANAKLFAGYRISNDDFPVYQQELVTNDGGEFNLGIVFSMWRDRATDARRVAVDNARLGVREARIELRLARLMTQRNAARAYWRWLATGRELAVYRQLAALAEKRMIGLEQRVKAGDVAAIFVVENRQNLLRRQALVTTAERDFRLAAIELSLYLRDAAGRPLRALEVELPQAFPSADLQLDNPQSLVEAVLARRPELALLDVDRARGENDLRLAQNLLKPRVDVGIKAAQDLGDGSRAREGFEAIVDITISIPLERRRALGQADSARATLQRLEFDRQMQSERLANELAKLGVAIDAARRFVDITHDEAAQADIMERAERRRFEAGASDFFLVNLREERSADARLRNLGATLSYFAGLVDYQATIVDLDALGLTASADF
jgi:outer membrane protein TolC